MTDSAESPRRKRGPRHDGRLAAVQFFYQLHAHGGGGLEDLGDFWELRPVGQLAKDYAELLIRGMLQDRPQLDQRIALALDNYTLERVGPSEAAILRCATWELFHAPDGPPKAVVLDEAVEIASRLGGSESARFVNGVLDRIAKGNPGGEPAALSPDPA